jgi:ribonuclease BN (tRNA processing enzyme)
MKLQFLGSGSAFTMENFQSNMVLWFHNNMLLIDCGSDIRFSLAKQKLTYRDITHVYISHLHADHVGGLEWLALSRYFDPKCDRPVLFISEHLVDDLWSRTLSGGLSTIQGQPATLETFFNVQRVRKNESFVWGPIPFKLVQTIHVVDGFTFMFSFGLLFDTDSNNTVFITTDTQYCPNQIMDFYEMADIIFQDCETAPFKSGVHAHFEELRKLPDRIKAKMYLYHYQDPDTNGLPDAEKSGFSKDAFIKQGGNFII